MGEVERIAVLKGEHEDLGKASGCVRARARVFLHVWARMKEMETEKTSCTL